MSLHGIYNMYLVVYATYSILSTQQYNSKPMSIKACHILMQPNFEMFCSMPLFGRAVCGKQARCYTADELLKEKPVPAAGCSVKISQVLADMSEAHMQAPDWQLPYTACKSHSQQKGATYMCHQLNEWLAHHHSACTYLTELHNAAGDIVSNRFLHEHHFGLDLPHLGHNWFKGLEDVLHDSRARRGWSNSIEVNHHNRPAQAIHAIIEQKALELWWFVEFCWWLLQPTRQSA